MIAQAIEFVKRQYASGAVRSGPVAGAREDDVPSAGPRDAAVAAESAGDETVAGLDDVDPQRLAMTSDEQVLAHLREEGGRVGQGDIVDALELSPATISRRLGEMEESGEVVRYQVGRRKIVCLPGSCPDGARSPFER